MNMNVDEYIAGIKDDKLRALCESLRDELIAAVNIQDKKIFPTKFDLLKDIDGTKIKDQDQKNI